MRWPSSYLSGLGLGNARLSHSQAGGLRPPLYSSPRAFPLRHAPPTVFLLSAGVQASARLASEARMLNVAESEQCGGRIPIHVTPADLCYSLRGTSHWSLPSIPLSSPTRPSSVFPSSLTAYLIVRSPVVISLDLARGPDLLPGWPTCNLLPPPMNGSQHRSIPT